MSQVDVSFDVDELIIDTWAYMEGFVSKREPTHCRRFFFPATFGGIVMRGVQQGKQNLQCYRNSFQHQGRLDHCSKVFIPILENIIHWYLCFCDMGRKEAHLLDSLPSCTGNTFRLKNVKKLLKNLAVIFGKQSLICDIVGHPMVPFDKLKLLIPPDVPKQCNSDDCGMFVINFMQNVHKGAAKDVRVGNWDRYHCLYRMVTNPYNMVREDVIVAAQTFQKERKVAANA